MARCLPSMQHCLYRPSLDMGLARNANSRGALVPIIHVKKKKKSQYYNYPQLSSFLLNTTCFIHFLDKNIKYVNTLRKADFCKYSAQLQHEIHNKVENNLNETLEVRWKNTNKAWRLYLYLSSGGMTQNIVKGILFWKDAGLSRTEASLSPEEFQWQWKVVEIAGNKSMEKYEKNKMHLSCILLCICHPWTNISTFDELFKKNRHVS